MSAGRLPPISATALATLLATAAVGCAPTPASRLHLLQAPTDAAAAVDADGGPVVFVDPAVVAAYADRTQLVTRTRDGRVLLDERDAWAEPPGAQVTAALVDGLAARFGADDVLATPQRREFAPDYRVAVEVLRLDADGAGAAVLDARWTLFAGGEDERFAGTGRERLVEPIGGAGDVGARVAAFDRALARLAERLAEAVSAEAALRAAGRAGAGRRPGPARPPPPRGA